MNDMELADEIETGRLSFRRMVRRGEQIGRDLTDAEEEQIIAALRQADLAQTEIKGHMRVEDELRAELKLGPHITGAAPAYTGEGVSMLEVSSVAHVNPRKGRAAIYERAFQLERELALAQARIAELEKDAARYRWLRDVRARKEYRIDGWEGAMWSVEGLHDPHEKGFDAAIDAALKSRA